MKKKFSIIFLGKTGCNYSKKISYYLKKKGHQILFYKTDIGNLKKIKKKIQDKKKKFDFLFSFRSQLILDSKILDKIKIASINFHPGPPNYRGIGCTNFALLKNEKRYGVTCHLISKKIDAGKILNVKYFSINKYDNIETLLQKAHKEMYIQFFEIFKKLQSKKNAINDLIILNKNIKWSNKLYMKKDMENLYVVKKNVSKKKLDLLVRSCNTRNYKLYFQFHGKKFFYLG